MMYHFVPIHNCYCYIYLSITDGFCGFSIKNGKIFSFMGIPPNINMNSGSVFQPTDATPPTRRPNGRPTALPLCARSGAAPALCYARLLAQGAGANWTGQKAPPDNPERAQSGSGVARPRGAVRGASRSLRGTLGRTPQKGGKREFV